MRSSLLLPVGFVVLLSVGVFALTRQGPTPQGKAPRLVQGGLPPAEPGTLPDSWIHGADCDNDPQIQVHAYNEDFYILRQSKCDTYEAPFLYLIFGSDRVLLVDTGSAPSSPVKDTVFGIVNDWLISKGKASIDLIVGHSHSHGDHVASDGQFIGLPGVTHVDHGVPNVASFYGIANWPTDVGQIDLGGRVLDVLATPGHKNDSVTFYDRRTHLLLTGDIVYPGHLFIFAQAGWFDFKDSMVRLEDWAAKHPVKHVLGCHIEMTADAGVSYQYGTLVQPNEHTLQLAPTIFGQIRAAADTMGDDPVCQSFDEFVIHPVYKCGFGYF